MTRMSARGPVLAVCGLAFEAAVAAGPQVVTVSRGGRSAALAAAIEQEIDRGVVALISFGVAGALVPEMRPGTLIVADAIVTASGRVETHARWAGALRRRLPQALGHAIAGVDRLVTDAAEKRALGQETGAAAVDMESHIVARIAHERGLPFVALRAVADPLRRSMPPAAQVAMREDGGVDLPAVLGSIARSPLQLPELLRIGLDSRRALSALRESRRLLGDRLGYADLDELLVDVI